MPLADHEIHDPRIKRTRRMLQDALRKLLEKKSFDEILVQDIAEAATVNRATFYDHYADKYDLFNALVASDFNRLLEERNVCFDGSCSSGLAAIVLAVSDYLHQAQRERVECSRQASTGALTGAAIVNAVRRILLDGLTKHVGELRVAPGVIATAASGAIYGAVHEWFVREKHQPDDNAVSSLVQLVHPILEQAVAPAHDTAARPVKRRVSAARPAIKR